jgi:hypothetical protein
MGEPIFTIIWRATGLRWQPSPSQLRFCAHDVLIRDLHLAIFLAGVAFAGACLPAVAQENPEPVLTKEQIHFRDKIRPLLEKYCYECHGEKKQKGDLNLAVFTDLDSAAEHQDVWVSVLERVLADEMPPEGAAQMKFGQRHELLDWTRKFRPKEIDCSKLATDRTVDFYRGSVMSRRLNRDEYNHTIRDLLGLDLRPGAILPADGAGGEGFDTTGDTLFTSSLTIEKYFEAAETALGAVLPDDPETLGTDAAAARARLLSALPGEGRSVRDAAGVVLDGFMRRAFRRPVEGEEVQKFLKVFDHAHTRGDGFDKALRLALTGVLVSPHFLFLVEPEHPDGDIQPLGAFPLASRLSYFLWATMPDEELFAAAASGEILADEGYLKQLRRMLRDPRASSLGERFAMQWLEIDKLGGEVRPDGSRFPEFDEALAAAMKEEVVRYFNFIIGENRPLTELITSDYSFANERLAKLYGIEGVAGPGFQQVKFSSPERGGITGMAAVHALTSYPLRTSPVLRGRWILEVLLGEKVPPPPPDVPALAADEHEVTAANLREQLEKHRTDPTCNSCHQRMDPLGFALETFDNLGRARFEVDGQAIDVSARLPNGEEFSGPEGLKKILTKRRDPILRHLVKKLTGYALGRPLNRYDDCVIKDGMKALAANEFRPTPLIETIALSKPFRYRYHPRTVQAAARETQE